MSHSSRHVDTGKVAICIATCRRPVGLARLVRSLQSLNMECGEQLSLDVIVADNDSAGSASTSCSQLSRESRWPITYVAEPRRGVAFARNAAVRCAIARGANYIAFVDDDEVPTPTWLEELWLTMTRYAADIVAGPVLPQFESPVARWILDGAFFDRPRPPTGTQLDRVRSGNILMRADIFERVGRLFDERFVSMGEDTDFFFHAARAGCRIVWANDAIVHESIPESRTQAGWLVKRSYSVGIFWGEFGSDRSALRRGALRGMVKGALLLPWSLLQGRAAMVRALQLIATGIGYLRASAGSLHERYRHTGANQEARRR
jgi:succinoglycan biosynthesis protein ExoM